MNSKQHRVLILAANPHEFGRLQLDKELHQIQQGLLSARAQIEIQICWATRLRDLHRAMLDFRPTLVHFSGYGAGSEGLYLEDGKGHAHLVATSALGQLFQLFSEGLKCVVLNACYSEPQAAELAKHIDYVIGISSGIADDEAIEFSTAFYEALGAGESIQFSFGLACNALQLRGRATDQPFLLLNKLSSSRPKRAYNDNQDSEAGHPILESPRPQAKARTLLRVFLCHASEDKPSARKLHERLQTDGFEPWLDEQDLLPGEDWDWAIRQALKRSDAVLVLLSNAATSKAGYLQKEIRFALDIYQEQPPGAIYLIPAKIEPCRIPDHLSHLQVADLTTPAGYKKVIQALQRRKDSMDRNPGLTV